VEALQVCPERLVAWLGPPLDPSTLKGREVREALGKRREQRRSLCRMTRAVHGGFDALARRRLCSLGVSRIYGGGLHLCRRGTVLLAWRDG